MSGDKKTQMTDYIIEYDATDPTSIEMYSKKMIGKTFRQLWKKKKKRKVMVEGKKKLSSDGAEDKKNKGNLGGLIEERFFHYACNNEARPDFPEAGVELKVSPYKLNRNGTFSAKERLILTMIDYMKLVEETSFEESHMWQKSRLILLVYYLYRKDIRYNLDYKINYSRLFTPPEQDVAIIRNDYYTIQQKVKDGKAHELSEGDTLYLGAATKASSSKDRRMQPYNVEPAKPRAFAFKTSYMTYVLNNYIVPGRTTYQPIINKGTVDSLERYVNDKLAKYKGWSIERLGQQFDIDIQKKPKNLGALLAYRILGIKGNKAEEFVKANVVIKTIRIENNDRIKENMSFPAFKFKELVEEEWEDSTFGNLLRETRFFFVVYKFDQNGTLRLRGGQFWNMPYEDLEGNVKIVWETTKKVLIDGLEVTMVNGVRRNNFPKASENPICHVRPHARNAKDTYELPDGREYPKQCFWLNNSYIYSQLDDSLK